MSVMVHRQVGHAEAKLLEERCRIVDRCMFHAGGDDVVSGALICKRRSDQRQIVGLGSAGGKEDLFILHF